MPEVLRNFFIIVGSGLVLTGAVGLWRFSKSASRLHPPTKVSVLGLTLILIASMVDRYIETSDLKTMIFSREILCLVFAVVLSPLSGHVLLSSLKKSQKNF